MKEPARVLIRASQYADRDLMPLVLLLVRDRNRDRYPSARFCEHHRPRFDCVSTTVGSIGTVAVPLVIVVFDSAFVLLFVHGCSPFDCLD